MTWDAASSTEGLFDPSMERDACGVGFVAKLGGEKSHDIVKMGLRILVNLSHRGACGCDPQTGDGAGILTQMPDELLRPVLAEQGVDLPAVGEYGAGLIFLPRDAEERRYCEAVLERVIAEEGQSFLGWRDVPVNSEHLGWLAKEVEPTIRQVFIARGAETPADMFEWKLYVIRRVAENHVRGSQLRERKFFYAPSLSSRVMIYKGLMQPAQADKFYSDLSDERFKSALALVHQRYSTNTFPTWELAHPFRYLAHNGEINTLRGNINWMRARESVLASEKYGADLKKIVPICTPGASDSATFDNVLEMLVLTGRSLPEAMSMLIPEPWANHEAMTDSRKAYYQYKACLMEPWDGPASMAFTDGTIIGATLDRNGLRPSRYWLTKSGFVIMASETGVLDIRPGDVQEKGRLRPGRMLLVDTSKGIVVSDETIKAELSAKRPYREWLNQNVISLESLPAAADPPHANLESLRALQRAFGYTLEDLKILIGPMAADGAEPVGSMGNDAPLAVLSDRPQLLFHYFKQLFAQVTNPPLDAIREELVTSMFIALGPEGNLLEETPEQCRLLMLDYPIVTNHDLARIKELRRDRLVTKTLPTLFKRAEGAKGLRAALERLRAQASDAVKDGATILVLSDRGVDAEHVPIPALLAASGVHHHLIREGLRTGCGIVMETGEARETHHFALLLGYGVGAINPYLAFDTIHEMRDQGRLPDTLSKKELEKRYIKAVVKGVLKVMSKMGISTLQSYRGAQIFEAIGLNRELIDEFFSWTPSRIQGIGLETIAEESLARHEHAFPSLPAAHSLELDVGGEYQWRRKGEAHLLAPEVIAKLQHATRHNDLGFFREYCKLVDEQESRLLTLRGLMTFKRDRPPVPLEEVESVDQIVKRFATGAMSYGSISKEAHETLAIAMNRLGGRSNTGEGGEDPARYVNLDPRFNRKSAIKQVASGRFGVTSEYLVSAAELQIKMAQGAKPGEGGQLPGHKVDKEIARIRHSTPGVGLISPPPHHDIYSIEDLAQLIYDLKNANRDARISVKLVAEVGVGAVAAGVAKGKADVVLISGHDGGTGASPQTSIKHAGVPWELGLAEAHQVLVRNGLRSRIIVQTDGQLRTPRDLVIAAMLGAEEWGIATASLVVMGCVMMRKCHLNTCPVGIATQDIELRKKFHAQPEWVENFFRMLASEMRILMAELGFRAVNEMVGQVDCLEMKPDIKHHKAKGLDFSVLHHKQAPRPDPNDPEPTRYCSRQQDHGLDDTIDVSFLLDQCKPALEEGKPVMISMESFNVFRTFGTILSSEVTKKYGAKGLPDNTIQIHLTGSVGQSLLAFGAPGVTVTVEGDVNDYCGKGLSGGKIIVAPPRMPGFHPEEHVVAGNVVLYGATSGEVYLSGIAGERFCVRNSGALAVVEGVGDHGCEYMTGGRAVILGSVGRNFAAGMSGGIAYLYDRDQKSQTRINREMVEILEPDEDDLGFLKTVIQTHYGHTRSKRAFEILDGWDETRRYFRKIMPIDYRLALEAQKKVARAPKNELVEVAHG